MRAFRRLHLILHGKAADDERVRDALAAARAAGHRIELLVTEEPGDAERLAADAVAAAEAGDLDTIVAGGGDGTLNAVVSGALARSEKPACSFGLLPLGTANDFARSVGIPANDPQAALDFILAGEAEPLDVASFEAAGKRRHFVNMLTAGFGPRVTSEADPRLKAALGGLAYLLSGLGRLGEVTPWDGRASGAGIEWQGSFVALAVGNGRHSGGGIELCPHARLDDGLLELTIVEADDDDMLSALLASLPAALGGEHDKIVRARADRFEIETDEPVPISLDGEMLEASRMVLGVTRHAIRFHRGETPEAGQPE